MPRFAFRFSRWHRIVGAVFGVTPSTTVVEVTDDQLVARFGPWVLQTPLTNIARVEETESFAFIKTLGPAHLSVADRGLTMATNVDRAVCIHFTTPVRGIEPFGWVRHPGLTLTVERIADFRLVLEKPDHARDVASDAAPGRSPWQEWGRRIRWPLGMAVAAARYLASAGTVERSSESRPGSAPQLHDGDQPADLQPMSEGVGTAYERIYRIVISGSDLTPEQLLDRILADLNAVSPTEVAEFLARDPASPDAAPGQQYLVSMPGPWNSRVRVLGRASRSIRLGTLEGHMEAGEIEFTTGLAAARPSDGTARLVFQIRSLARSGDSAFRLLYQLLSLGERMQEYMWVHMCRRVATIAGGQRHGPITVKTIRYAG